MSARPSAPSRRLLLPLTLVLVGLMSVVAATLLIFDGWRGPGDPAPSAIGGPFSIASHDGRIVTEKDFLGRPTLLFFGFTRCPDVCPTALAEISALFEKLGPQAKVSAMFVSVDPERDTPALLADFLASFDKRIIGLSGDAASTQQIMKAYRVYARKVPLKDGDYTMDHTAIVYLIDKQGRFVNAFNIARPPEEAAKELARYL